MSAPVCAAELAAQIAELRNRAEWLYHYSVWMPCPSVDNELREVRLQLADLLTQQAKLFPVVV